MTAGPPKGPPIAKTIEHETVVHGNARADPYHWLRNVDDDPDVLEYLNAENRYAEQVLDHTQVLQQQLYDELVARRSLNEEMVPGRKGEYYYYLRWQQDLPRRIHCRRRGHPTKAEEEIILDLNAEAPHDEYLDVGQVRMSESHRFIAYGLDRTGEELYHLYVKDLHTGEVIDDDIRPMCGIVAWGSDDATFLYVERDHAGRPFRIWRHEVGRPGIEDQLLLEEPDTKFNLLLSKSRSGAYFFAIHRSRITREVRVLSVNDDRGQFVPLVPRISGQRVMTAHRKDSFYLAINDTSPNFRVAKLSVDLDRPPSDFIDASPERSIHRLLSFENHLVTFGRSNGLPDVRIDDLVSGEHRMLEFEEPTYALVEKGNLAYDASQLRLTYSSPRTPSSVFDFDLDTCEPTLMKRTEVFGDFDRTNYVVERVWAPASDGTRIPISLLRLKDVPRDGTAPLLLHGYGAYAVNADMSFYADRFSLVDRGVVNAIAHVRGGGEMGPSWWDDGRMFNKHNTFTDFIACAEHLIREGYCARGRVVAEGGSAGGLVMGAVVNMRPDLFAGVVASVPFVDVSSSMLDPSLRMTSTEYEEWGDPSRPEELALMDSYSPYDNVVTQEYPNLLVTCGLKDTRVHFWGPVKWVAKLRAMKTDHNILVLRTKMAAGHFGPTDRFAMFRETAYRYAFILDVLHLA